MLMATTMKCLECGFPLAASSHCPWCNSRTVAARHITMATARGVRLVAPVAVVILMAVVIKELNAIRSGVQW